MKNHNSYIDSIMTASEGVCALCGRRDRKLDRHEPWGGPNRRKSRKLEPDEERAGRVAYAYIGVTLAAMGRARRESAVMPQSGGFQVLDEPELPF